MTVYFLSSTPAALRLNGEYAGVIDNFPRRTEIGEGEEAFVEAVPSDNRLPVNFMLSDGFLSSPPPFSDVFLMGADALISINRYEPKSAALKVVWQTRFCDNLITLYSRGGAALCVDRPDGTADIYDINEDYLHSQYSSGRVGGKDVLCVFTGGRLCILTEGGTLAFDNAVKSYSLGDMLGVTVNFNSCAGAIGECNYSYDGTRFTLVSGRTVETRPVDDKIRHFAFFESVLTHAKPADYLSEELAPRAGELSGYLGDFSGVVVPPRKFYERTGEMRAAGLVYPLSANLYRVKFFSADMQGGKIINIREIDY